MWCSLVLVVRRNLYFLNGVASSPGTILYKMIVFSFMLSVFVVYPSLVPVVWVLQYRLIRKHTLLLISLYFLWLLGPRLYTSIPLALKQMSDSISLWLCLDSSWCVFDGKLCLSLLFSDTATHVNYSHLQSFLCKWENTKPILFKWIN